MQEVPCDVQGLLGTDLRGIAYSPDLQVVVTSHHDLGILKVNTLRVRAEEGNSLVLVEEDSIGGGGVFSFRKNGISGCLAFTTQSPTRLLVTDLGNLAVHIVDVPARRVLGRLQREPQSPRGVASRGPYAAVSCWRYWYSGDHCVAVYECEGDSVRESWRRIHTIRDGLPHIRPLGLGFSQDGTVLCVTQSRHSQLVDVAHDWSPVGSIALPPGGASDVEAWEDGGWMLVSASTNYITHVGPAGDLVQTFKCSGGSSVLPLVGPFCLTRVPGLGLLCVEYAGRTRVFMTPAQRGMHFMSPARVAWMSLACRLACARR
jgi:hypothetical protein